MTEDPLFIPSEALPVSVLTGFLGSGKTTLLDQLLKHPDMGRSAVIINEFGEIGLDHDLIASSKEDTVLLNSGCLCCTIRGDLVETMRRLYRERVTGEIPLFDRLLIETTGLADPAPILQTLMTDPLLSERFRLDGVITTVDALVGLKTLESQIEAAKQAAVADRLVITKCDLVAAPALDVIAARLKAINPGARQIRSKGQSVDPKQLFDAGLYDPKTKGPDVERWLMAEAVTQQTEDQDHGHQHRHHGHHDVNRHDLRIRAFCLTAEGPLDWDKLNAWVEMLITIYGAQLLRIKGVLNVAGEENPLAIHGVQHVFHPPAALPGWPSSDRRSRIVIIARDLAPDVVRQTFKDFGVEA